MTSAPNDAATLYVVEQSGRIVIASHDPTVLGSSLAESVAEAEELQSILQAAGIESELETAVEHHPRETEDAPQKVLVPETSLEAAKDAIEALTDPEEILDES